MELTHHDSRDYNVAKSEAAEEFRAKLDGWIHDGRTRAVDFFQKLEENRPVDHIVPVETLGFSINEKDQILVRAGTNDRQEFVLHPHALNQMIARTKILTQGVSTKMLDARTKVIDEAENVIEDRWGKELLLHNLHTIFSHNKGRRALFRTVGNEVRGFVSDRFNRLDCAPIIGAFAEQAKELGCVPIEPSSKYHPIFSQDIKNGFAMFLPMIFEPVKDEVLIVGLAITNSDFGGTMLTVRLVVVRLWCTNMAYRMDCLRKVHLGATLPEDIEMSVETFEANTRAMSLSVRDVVKGMLGPARINAELALIEKAAKETIDPKAVFGDLRRAGLLNKGETERVIEVYNQPEIVLLPPGQNRWRASNAISLFANELEEKGEEKRAVEVRIIAGKLLDDIDPEAKKNGKNKVLDAEFEEDEDGDDDSN